MKMVSLDLYCNLVAIFVVLALDAMVSVKHGADIIRRNKIKVAELQGQERSLSEKIKGIKQGLAASVKGLSEASGKLQKTGETIMRLKSVTDNCKKWDNTDLGMGKYSGSRVLVRVNSYGRRVGSWRYWCRYDGIESSPNKKDIKMPLDLEKMIARTRKLLQKLLEIKSSRQKNHK